MKKLLASIPFVAIGAVFFSAIGTSPAQAVTRTFNVADAGVWTVPANVTSITVTMYGGSAGYGATDGAGTTAQAGGARGKIVATYTVQTGDAISIYPGNKGTNATGGTSTGGGARGQDTNPYANYDGGTGGNSGSVGGSGGGGGGGAASVLLINGDLKAVAAGAGGGGGAGNYANSGKPGYSSHLANGTNLNGATGAQTVNCTTFDGGTTNDGGGSGGGGGGFYGGASQAPFGIASGNGECQGGGGYRGQNYLKNNAGTVSNPSDTDLTQNTNGSITIEYTVNAASNCSPTTTTFGLYTVQKFTSTDMCNWSVPAGVTSVDLFLVGGGGGGGTDGGGGGGGGATVSRSAVAVSPNDVLNITVGYGGKPSIFVTSTGSNAESSTVVVGATTVLANGGKLGVSGPGGAGGAGGLAGIGFAGGAGGTGTAASHAAGSTGDYGSTSYFASASVTQYGGGGAGGPWSSTGATLSAVAGRSGGGASGSWTSGSGNTVGGDATANSGGGGGAGAAGNNQTRGGNGADGVIFIRYATLTANNFPSSLSSALYARYLPTDMNAISGASRTAWLDSSGNSRHGSFPSIKPTVTTVSGNGSSATLLAADGGTSTDVSFFDDLPSGYTLINTTRYSGATKGRIFTSRIDGNLLSGFWNGQAGVAHHNGWITSTSTPAAAVSSVTNWLISSDQLSLYRANGLDVTTSTGTSSRGFSINQCNACTSNGENSDWQSVDIMVFNRALTNIEMRAVEVYMRNMYSLSVYVADSRTETDTAYTNLSGNRYLYAASSANLDLSDTFTVEAWIKPSATCDGVYECMIYGRERHLVWAVYQGQLRYALWNASLGWEWQDTQVKVKSGEWHHVAISKEAAGNTSNSLKIYLDGQLAYTKSGSPYRTTDSWGNTTSYPVSPSAYTLFLGVRESGGGTQNFIGQIDEVRQWKGFRTPQQIQYDMHNYADLTNSALQLYFDFNQSNTSGNVFNQAYGAAQGTNLTIVGAPSFTDVKIVDTTTMPTHTIIKFPRTYLTGIGGWKVPANIDTATVAVIGGGSGGSNRANYAGSGGGIFVATNQAIPAGIRTVEVGVGGLGALATAGDNAAGGSGGSTTFGSTVAVGASATASGAGTFMGTAYSANSKGAVVSSGDASGGGGGGATSAGSNASSNMLAGAGGSGKLLSITGSDVCYAAGGGGASNPSGTVALGGTCVGSNAASTAGTGSRTSSPGGSALGNSGSGGGGGSYSGATNYAGGNGGSGFVVIRYLNVSTISFTSPANKTTTAGISETFTVGGIPATPLARSVQWQKSTDSGSNWSNIESATSITYNTGTLDVSTSGSQYKYRAIVTDYDTITTGVIGLSLSDTGTAFHLTINAALSVTGSSSISATVSKQKTTTYTITGGTSTYTTTLSPTVTGITLDTSTALSPIIKVETTTATNTYYETLTVIDSVGATVRLPVTIIVSKYPVIIGSGVSTSGVVLNMDASGYSGSGNWLDTSVSARSFTPQNAPVYSTDSGGIFKFNGTNQYFSTSSSLASLNNYTIETWFKTNSATPTGSIISETYVNNAINYTFGFQNDGSYLSAGYYGSPWYEATTRFTPTPGLWYHAAVRFDNATKSMRIFVNGVDVTYRSPNMTGVTLYTGQQGILIGRRWDTTGSPYFNGSIASVRILNTPLSNAQILKNYRATAHKFTNSDSGVDTATVKYGNNYTATFNALYGSGSKSFSPSSYTRTGFTWDTSTANTLGLTVTPAIGAGSYSETLTATDENAASTVLNLTITVSKADTVTVTVDTITAVTYPGNATKISPTVAISGLVGSDTATATSAVITFKRSATTCALGGACSIGDTGPGGGKVFYDAGSTQSWGRYLEAAPSNWSTTDTSTAGVWCSGPVNINSTILGYLPNGIGQGWLNTQYLTSVCTGGAVYKARTYAGAGLNDWYLPTGAELAEMAKSPSRTNLGLVNNLSKKGYWGSNENTQNGDIASLITSTWEVDVTVKGDSTNNMVRPIRAFDSNLSAYDTTTVPVNVGTYSMVPSALTLTGGNTAGLLSNYETVTYVSRNVTIDRATQSTIAITTINSLFDPVNGYTLSASGGSSIRPYLYTLVSAGSAGCTLSGTKLKAANAGTCTVKASKAQDLHYLAAFSADTTVNLFSVFVFSQPTGNVGGGGEIGINGSNNVETRTAFAPVVTNFVNTTLGSGRSGIVGDILTFTGKNFVLGSTVEFQSASGVIVVAAQNVNTTNPDANTFTVAVPAGAVSGPLAVTNNVGARRTFTFTLS